MTLSLGLITIHFDYIGAETSQTDTYVNAIQSDADSDDFSRKKLNVSTKTCSLAWGT